MYSDVSKILFTKEQIQKRVNELGKQISDEFRGQEVLMVCVLKGSSVFYADLVRAMDIPVEFDFIHVSSYEGSVTTGEVKINKDLTVDITGKNIVVVEDIIDTGVTMKALVPMLLARGPKSVKVCAMLDKPARRRVDFKGDYIGFEIPDEFVIGYGLDYAHKYRNIPEICVFDTSKLNK